MSARWGTTFFLASLVTCVAVYDLVIAARVHRATISSVVLDATYTKPWGMLIPLSVGLLLGHLFIPQVRSP